MGEQRPGVSCVGWPRRSLGGAAVGAFLFSTPARNLFSCPPHILPPLFLSDPKMTFLCVLYPYTLTPCIGVRKERVDVLCPNDLGQFSNFRQLCNWFFLKMLLSCFKYYSRDEKRIIHFPVEWFLFPDSCISSVLWRVASSGFRERLRPFSAGAFLLPASDSDERRSRLQRKRETFITSRHPADVRGRRFRIRF